MHIKPTGIAYKIHVYSHVQLHAESKLDHFYVLFFVIEGYTYFGNILKFEKE